MWDLSGPGLEPVSPALAGGFLSTAPPGKSSNVYSFLTHKMHIKAFTFHYTGIEDEKVLGIKWATGGFPGGAVVENPPANAGDTGSSPGPGRSHTPWSN